MFARSSWLVWPLLTSIMLLGTLFAIACVDENTPAGATATPQSPTLSATPTATVEASKPPPPPTPTPIPTARECPADKSTCDLALQVRDALARGDSRPIASLGKTPLPIACPVDPSPLLGIRQLCASSPGVTRLVYSVGIYAKSFQLLDDAAFAALLQQSLTRFPTPGTIRSVGCSLVSQSGKTIDCAKQFALTIGYESPTLGEEALVLLFVRSGADGSAGLVGLRRWILDDAVVNGGPEDLGQEGFPYDGNFWFIPWKP